MEISNGLGTTHGVANCLLIRGERGFFNGFFGASLNSQKNQTILTTISSSFLIFTMYIIAPSKKILYISGSRNMKVNRFAEKLQAIIL
jgi:hypothetical protein